MGTCNGWEGYLPDPDHPDHLPMRFLRVNFHVMNSRDSSHNFRPKPAGFFLREPCWTAANAALDTNDPQLALAGRNGGAAQKLPLRVMAAARRRRYLFPLRRFLVLLSIRRQKPEQLQPQSHPANTASATDSILNIFLQVHPRDSFSSKTYRANGQGIALGTSLKMAGVLESSEGPESFDGLLNHEVGHILGISHAWVEDGCPDTDNHPNKCWTGSKDPPCRDLATNNMMDYNAYQMAMTPCQIGRVHQVLSSDKSRLRRCLVPTWCERREGRDVVIQDSVVWSGARDLEGNQLSPPPLRSPPPQKRRRVLLGRAAPYPHRRAGGGRKSPKAKRKPERCVF